MASATAMVRTTTELNCGSWGPKSMIRCRESAQKSAGKELPDGDDSRRGCHDSNGRRSAAHTTRQQQTPTVRTTKPVGSTGRQAGQACRCASVRITSKHDAYSAREDERRRLSLNQLQSGQKLARRKLNQPDWGASSHSLAFSASSRRVDCSST